MHQIRLKHNVKWNNTQRIGLITTAWLSSCTLRRFTTNLSIVVWTQRVNVWNESFNGPRRKGYGSGPDGRLQLQRLPSAGLLSTADSICTVRLLLVHVYVLKVYINEQCKNTYQKVGGSPRGEPIDPQKWGGLEPNSPIGVYAYVLPYMPRRYKPKYNGKCLPNFWILSRKNCWQKTHPGGAALPSLDHSGIVS